MTRICYYSIVLITIGLSACFPNLRLPGDEVVITDTGINPDVRIQLRQQQDFMFVINSKGHSQKIPAESFFNSDRNLSDSDYTKTLRNTLSTSYFAQRRRVSSVEDFDSDLRPYASILENHSWDPCVMYISNTNFEEKSYTTAGTPGSWTGGPHPTYIPGSPGVSNSRLKITFTIHYISYGKYMHQYTVSKEIDYPSRSEDYFNSLASNFKNILDEFFYRCVEY